jgi:hypothetical protein
LGLFNGNTISAPKQPTSIASLSSLKSRDSYSVILSTHYDYKLVSNDYNDHKSAEVLKNLDADVRLPS